MAEYIKWTPREMCEEIAKKLQPMAEGIFGTRDGVKKAQGLGDLRDLAREFRKELLADAA